MKQKPPPRKSLTEGAVKTLQSLAMSILDNWSSPRKQTGGWTTPTSNPETHAGSDEIHDDDVTLEKEEPVLTTEVLAEDKSEDDQDSVNPLRYLFLLGVLPATFGSLFALGYSTIQILVIGAYIVTSYFFFVEGSDNNGETGEDLDVYARIENVLQKVLAEPEVGNGDGHQYFPSADKESNNITNGIHNQQGLDGLQYFKLLNLLDDKSAAFIKKFDAAMRTMYPEKKPPQMPKEDRETRRDSKVD